MRQFRITLDGVALNDEPLGLIDTELNIVRDEKLKGIFFSYTTDLTFYGDGYSILRGYRDNGCASVPCVIEYDCDMSGAYQALFEGVIPIGSPDIEWNESDCTVVTKVENADFSNFLETYGDYEFRINTPFCLDGVTPLAQITPVFPVPFTDTSKNTSAIPARSYYFVDALRQCLAYLSNNAISLDEDALYNTLYRMQVLDFSWTGNFTDMTDLTVNYKNFYGQEFSVNVNPSTTSANEFFLAFSPRVIEFPLGLAAVQARNIHTNNHEMGGAVDRPNQQIRNMLPWSDISFSSTPNNFTITESQSFNYGLKNLVLTTDSLMLGQDSDISLTLNRLMFHAVGVDNMGYFLRPTSPTTYDLVLRFYPDLIDNTNTDVHLEKVTGIMSKTSVDFNAQVLTTPKGGTFNIDKTFSWSSGLCYGSNNKVEAEGISSGEIFETYAQNKADGEIRLFFHKDGNPNEAQDFILSINYYDAGLANYTLTEQYLYNAPYFMGLVAWRSVMYAGGNDWRGQIESRLPQVLSTCANCPDAVIENDSGVLFKNVYSFEHQLSFSQVQAIISQSLQFITFSDTQGINKTGFIKEITIPFKTFIANIELYTS